MTAVSESILHGTLPEAADGATDDLVLYAHTGDAAAFERVVRRHADMVFTFCRRALNHDASLAEDATQAVFIVLARKAAGGAAPPAGHLSGWLFITSRYCCDNLRRAQARRAKHERKAALMRRETPQTDSSGKDTETEIHQAMARLRDGERQVLLLRFFEKMSLREVGLALNISEAAAKFRVNRALQRMSKFLTGTSAGAMAAGALPMWLQSNATTAAPQAVVSSTISAGLGSAPPAAVAAANATVTGMAVGAAMKIAAAVAGSVLLVGGIAGGVAVVLPATGPGSTQPNLPAVSARAPVAIGVTPPTTQPGNGAIDLSTPEATLRSYVRAMRGGDVKAMERCLLYPANEQNPGELRGAMLIEFGMCQLAQACERQLGGVGPAMYRFPTLRGQLDALVDRALSKLPGPIVPDGNTAVVPMREEGNELVSQDKVDDIRWYGFWNKTVLHLVLVGNEWKLDTDATFQALAAIKTRGVIKDQAYKPTLPVKEMARRAYASKVHVFDILQRATADVLNGTLTTEDEVNDRLHNELAALFEKQDMLIPRYVLMPKTR